MGMPLRTFSVCWNSGVALCFSFGATSARCPLAVKAVLPGGLMILFKALFTSCTPIIFNIPLMATITVERWYFYLELRSGWLEEALLAA
jgi:hypothetical protein